MVSKDTTSSSTAAKAATPPFLLNWGQDRTEAAMGLQKAILESYEQASRAWLDRVQSEVSLWSDLANKLSATKSVPEALETYTKCVAQRMQMAADDGRRMVNEAQQMTQKFAQTLGNGWPTAST
jgi:phasin protein